MLGALNTKCTKILGDKCFFSLLEAALFFLVVHFFFFPPACHVSEKMKELKDLVTLFSFKKANFPPPPPRKSGRIVGWILQWESCSVVFWSEHKVLNQESVLLILTHSNFTKSLVFKKVQ